MTNFCQKCPHQDHESNMVYQKDGTYLCKSCHKSNKVDNPNYYKAQGIEAIDVIESFDLGFNLGNCIKYILRAGKKDDFNEDLEKAIWYLQRQINKNDKT